MQKRSWQERQGGRWWLGRHSEEAGGGGSLLVPKDPVPPEKAGLWQELVHLHCREGWAALGTSLWWLAQCGRNKEINSHQGRTGSGTPGLRLEPGSVTGKGPGVQPRLNSGSRPNLQPKAPSRTRCMGLGHSKPPFLPGSQDKQAATRPCLHPAPLGEEEATEAPGPEPLTGGSHGGPTPSHPTGAAHSLPGQMIGVTGVGRRVGGRRGRGWRGVGGHVGGEGGKNGEGERRQHEGGGQGREPGWRPAALTLMPPCPAAAHSH